MQHLLIAILILVVIVGALAFTLHRAGLLTSKDGEDKWWTWQWDTVNIDDLSIGYTHVVRWRRGWVTLYKFVGAVSTDWRLFLPFDINVGIDIRNKK